MRTRKEKIPIAASDRTRWSIALLVTLCFAFGNWGLEYTSLGHWLQFETFGALRALLPAFDREPLPVVVVDISNLASFPDHPTSRKDLQHLVEVISEQKPAAIGIDIDFSPHENSPQPREDEKFFDFCYKLTQGKSSDGTTTTAVPIFLGIHRTLFQSPEYWLGYPDYNDMAVAIGVRPKDTRLIPRWITGPAYGDQTRLPSMGEALAEAYLKGRDEAMPKPGPLSLLLETIPSDPFADRKTVVGGVAEEVERPAPEGFRYGLSPINYSKLEELDRETVPVDLQGGNPVLSGKFEGKIVLLGDATVEDTFTVPGPVQPVRGVYLHASAAYTFTRQPLYEFRASVRFLLDILLSVGLVVLLSRLEELDEEEKRREEPRRLAAVLILVLVLGWLLVRFVGVLWLDFVAIIVALALHPSVEKSVHHRWETWRAKSHHSPLAAHKSKRSPARVDAEEEAP